MPEWTNPGGGGPRVAVGTIPGRGARSRLHDAEAQERLTSTQPGRGTAA